MYFSEVKIAFSKRQGTGNDFIIINNFDGRLSSINHTTIKFLCDRKFGIGSDGLILINKDNNTDFKMVFYNPDGSESFCGNGARCAVSFFVEEIQSPNLYRFSAIDGIHEYKIEHDIFGIKMADVDEIISVDKDFVLNTGSPHFVRFSTDISTEHVLSIGRDIRYSAPYKQSGINVNLLNEHSSDQISIATYERGVEDETLSCGTGATACALVMAKKENSTSGIIKVLTKGGTLTVEFEKEIDRFQNIWLKGPASLVFKGEITLPL